MKRIPSVLLSASLSLAVLYCGPDSEPKPDRPEAALSGSILPDGRISIEVSVPDKHHAYLDAGREGHLIPVSFTWNLPGQNAAPTAQIKPTGELYEEAGARVLRGHGHWVFQPTGPVDEGEVKIRTQICDEIKGICFPPRTEPLTLKKREA